MAMEAEGGFCSRVNCTLEMCMCIYAECVDYFEYTVFKGLDIVIV